MLNTAILPLIAQFPVFHKKKQLDKKRKYYSVQVDRESIIQALTSFGSKADFLFAKCGTENLLSVIINLLDVEIFQKMEHSEDGGWG